MACVLRHMGSFLKPLQQQSRVSLECEKPAGTRLWQSTRHAQFEAVQPPISVR